MADLLIDDDGAVRILTMNRPDKRNALNLALSEALGRSQDSRKEQGRERYARAKSESTDSPLRCRYPFPAGICQFAHRLFSPDQNRQVNLA